ncbi:DUF2895 family protein [Salmonella enterica]|uniref:DUF2895 family protein n=1 Tax=Salmonella enterica TaxID=28901 RepID=UPI00261B9045|nr:DUF2895 family protein [Salmonella enterica]MDN4552597.1 DUF2895 family protein [Salmonella enterica subsp. enterica serovar Typhimurium]
MVFTDLVVDEYISHRTCQNGHWPDTPCDIVRWEGDPERNAFGLALDCYKGVPQRLEAAVVPEPEKRGCFNGDV